MASSSNHLDADRPVADWLEREAPAIAEHGYITVHVDELLELPDRADVVDASLSAFSALIRNGEAHAQRSRLLLSFPLQERDDAVPLTPDVEQGLWSELDPDEPPSLSVVTVDRDRKLFDEESYLHPLSLDRAPKPESGSVTTHYVASRSRLYRENEWNFVAAIVLEYFPADRT